MGRRGSGEVGFQNERSPQFSCPKARAKVKIDWRRQQILRPVHYVIPPITINGDAAPRDLSIPLLRLTPLQRQSARTCGQGAAVLAQEDYMTPPVRGYRGHPRRYQAAAWRRWASPLHRRLRVRTFLYRHPQRTAGTPTERPGERGVLVRRFDAPYWGSYIRITIISQGSDGCPSRKLERLEGLP